jgi:autotransporter passenger strand-loop-strand repeat protein
MTTTNVSGGDTITSAVLSSGDDVNVFSAGTTIATAISGGKEIVFSGGRAVGTTISGGAEYVFSGGTASGTTVTSSSDGVVSGGLFVAGGTASGTTVNVGGSEKVLAGGTAVGTTISGGAEYVFSGGTARGTTVNVGGSENVSSGGTASGTTISGGIEDVYSGGTASGATIAGSGTLDIWSGGTASGGILFSGNAATLIIGGTTMPTTIISGLAVTDSIVLSDLTYATSDTVSVSGDSVTVTGGGVSDTLTIAGAANDTFVLNSATGGGTSITVTDPAPTIMTGSEITNTPAPVISGNGEDGDTVTLFDGSTIIGTGTVGANGAWSITPSIALTDGLNAITATQTDVAGNPSVASGPVNMFVVQAPVHGISTTDFSSADLSAVLSEGATMAFVSGTEAVILTDGTLSVGPDTNEATIQRLYEGLLGRSADTTGLSAFDAQLASGVSKATVATEIMSSNEYITDHGTQTDQQFVTSLYQGLLGRAPEPAGFASWTSDLAQGASRGGVAVGIADSSEAKSYLAATTAQVFVPSAAGTLVTELYETGLGRAPDQAGLQYFTAAYSTQAPSQIAAAITASSEFLADHAGQSNSAYVTSLYQDGLGRAPETAGLDSWTALLNNGTLSRSAVLLDIATSPEAAGHLTHPLSA